MPKKTGRMGGFTAQNSGRIENCYSVVRLDIQKQLAGGFAGENTGIISQSYSYTRLKNLAGGFSGNGGGKTDKSYFFHEEKRGSKRLEKLCDPIRDQRLQEIKKDEDVQNLGFDTEAIWERSNGKAPLRFISDNWLYDIRQSPNISRYIKAVPESDPVDGGTAVAEKVKIQAIVIQKADELWEMAKRINEGDRVLAGSLIRLDADIDLGGKEWIPIGKERTCAFTGIFDGCGHTIKNFVIKDKNVENKGFFGFLKGAEVYNLTVDCNLKGGACAGGLAAQSDGGTIGCCAAIVEIKGKSGSYGGLVGLNTGSIFESYAAGRMIAILIPWWWGLPLLGLLLAGGLALRFPGALPTFAPVPYDRDQLPIPGESIAPNTDGNFVSFQFEQKIEVSLATGLCKFNFKNPGNSNHNIVVQLQFTDAQAVRVMGSTGRTDAEQKRLDDNPNYDPEAYRMVIAESGAIRPGYQLEDLKLVAQPNGATVPPGDYNAMVYLVFYDIDTNNRAMLESQLPVVITVQ